MPKKTLPDSKQAAKAAEICDRIRASRCQNKSAFFRDFWAVLTSDLSKSAKLTRLALLGFADATDDEIGIAFPGLATLAALTRQSERGVRRDTAELAEAGWLSKTDRGHQTTEYDLSIPERTLAELGSKLNGDIDGRTHEDIDGRTIRTPMSENLLSLSAQRIGPDSDSEQAAESPHKSAERASGEDNAIWNARRIAHDLRDFDTNRVLSDKLFHRDAYAELAGIVDEYGEARVRQAVNGFLAADRSGHPKRRGHVQFWRYFRITIEREDRECIPAE